MFSFCVTNNFSNSDFYCCSSGLLTEQWTETLTVIFTLIRGDKQLNVSGSCHGVLLRRWYTVVFFIFTRGAFSSLVGLFVAKVPVPSKTQNVFVSSYFRESLFTHAVFRTLFSSSLWVQFIYTMGTQTQVFEVQSQNFYSIKGPVRENYMMIFQYKHSIHKQHFCIYGRWDTFVVSPST